ncbi:MAG: VOC family protein [Gemmatimonadetes bacterium]|nr:VOC family protein [Gemmatimonadota bacterium]
MTGIKLSDTTRVGGVRLQVADLERSSAFYRDVIGFTPIAGERNAFGAPGGSRALVTLVEHRGAAPVPPRGRLGLFHFAILLPSREALAGALVHLHTRGVQLGMSDHLVSEALYLSDPDGLGIEIYRDRPRVEWKTVNGTIAMATEPLDVQSLLAEFPQPVWNGAPAGTTIGHMHLHVRDLGSTEAFYVNTLGLDLVTRDYPGALFMSAGGYHHHLGANTWARQATAPQPNEAQLLDWELVVRDAAEVTAVQGRLAAAGYQVTNGSDGSRMARDPSGTAMRIVAG